MSSSILHWWKINLVVFDIEKIDSCCLLWHTDNVWTSLIYSNVFLVLTGQMDYSSPLCCVQNFTFFFRNDSWIRVCPCITHGFSYLWKNTGSYTVCTVKTTGDFPMLTAKKGSPCPTKTHIAISDPLSSFFLFTNNKEWLCFSLLSTNTPQIRVRGRPIPWVFSHEGYWLRAI